MDSQCIELTNKEIFEVQAVHINYIISMQEQKDQIPDFIEKLLKMINQHPDLMNWGNQGEELVILNQKLFEQRVLHQFFRHGKLESFVRQLNMYGFHKVCRNKNSINFRNKFFFLGNQSNFNLIKRRKKDGEEEQPTNKNEQNLVKLINYKHGNQFPDLPKLVQQIFEFKARNDKTMNKLRKSLDVLGRQLSESKSKVVKPTICQIKEMISSIEGSSKKVEMNIQQTVQAINEGVYQVKRQELDGNIVQADRYPYEHQHQIGPLLPNAISTAITYPALHSSTGFFGTVFHPGATILGLSSHCSFTSATNLIN